MSWNKPSSAPQPLPKKSAPPSLKRGLLAGLLVVALGALGLYLFSGGEATSSSLQKKDRGLIKEVAPAAAPKFVPKPGMVYTTNRLGKVIEHPPTNKWGNPWHWGPYAKMPPAAHTSQVDRLEDLPLSHRLFDTLAERDIAALLTIEPGEGLMDVIDFDERFVKEFLESLKTPIIVTADDSEEAKAMKRAVNSTKIELKARHDAGEDIAKIMRETRKELMELGAYREELNRMVIEKTQDRTATREDLEDIVKAANMMLEERGIKKIEMPEFYYNQIELRNARFRAHAQKENQE